MTSPKDSSQKSDSARMDRLRQMIRQGKWPPPGFPWRSLASNPSLAREIFHSPGWKALAEDLQALKDREVDRLLYKVTSTEELFEARGLAKAIDLILELPREFEIIAAEKKSS